MKKMLSFARPAPALVLVFPLLAACAGHSDAAPNVDCSTVDPVPAFAQVEVFQNVCTDCHSTSKSGKDRDGAPSAINFDDYASASAHAEQAAIAVNSGAMPPRSSKFSLTDEEKTTLFDWAMCGAPQ